MVGCVGMEYVLPVEQTGEYQGHWKDEVGVKWMKEETRVKILVNQMGRTEVTMEKGFEMPK